MPITEEVRLYFVGDGTVLRWEQAALVGMVGSGVFYEGRPVSGKAIDGFSAR